MFGQQGVLQSIDWEIVGKLAAVFAAVFSAYAAYNSRKLVLALVSAQRLSVRPAAQLKFGDYEDRLFVGIENLGLGPMIIERVTVSKAGQTVGDGSLIYASGFPFDERFVEDFVGNLGDRLVQHGGETVLFSARGKEADPEFQRYLEALRRYLADVEFRIEYKDMYDVRQVPTRRSGKWFGRHFAAKDSPASPNEKAD